MTLSRKSLLTLAAVAARELGRDGRGQPASAPGADALRQMMHTYVRWAIRHPARFKLTFGSWSTDSAELAQAADAARAGLVAAVRTAQEAGDLPSEDPERVAALILAVAHGAADLEISGHLARSGKGHACAEDLVDDLLREAPPGEEPRERLPQRREGLRDGVGEVL